MLIRDATAKELTAMLAIYAYYVQTSSATFDTQTPNIETFSRRFDDVRRTCPWLVCEDDGAVVGYAYAAPAFSRAAYAWCAEVTVYLLPQAEGRGFAAALYTALEQRLRAQGYRVLIACITADNERSLAFHRRHGFEKSGFLPDCGWKLGTWHSVCWLHKRIGGTEPPLASPTPAAPI